MQKAELAKGSEPLMPQAIVVLQSLSLPVAPAHETETKTILILFNIFMAFRHPGDRMVVRPPYTPPND